MASGGKRGGGGERVLESRHVIGLFLVMMLFSAGFFTLGYLMGRDQSSGQTHAASKFHGAEDLDLPPKTVQPKASKGQAVPEGAKDPSAPTTDPAWEFYDASKSKQTDDHLKPLPPAAVQKNSPQLVKNIVPPKSAPPASKSVSAPLIPGGAYTLQVAALTKEADAMELATQLQKKKFPAFVQSSRTDKYFRVQVGPYADQKSAEAARKGLEGAGFKALVKHG
jgi:septal ring-binding cell division protein DamX